jgi:GGDEF domain-containing protein
LGLAPTVVPDEMDRLVQRVRDNLNAFNATSTLGFPLSLTICAVSVDHSDDKTIEEYVTIADHSMYEEKRLKKPYSIDLPALGSSAIEPPVGPIPVQS